MYNLYKDKQPSSAAEQTLTKFCQIVFCLHNYKYHSIIKTK